MVLVAKYRSQLSLTNSAFLVITMHNLVAQRGRALIGSLDNHGRSQQIIKLVFFQLQVFYKNTCREELIIC